MFIFNLGWLVLPGMVLLAGDTEDKLWAAARKGDVQAVEQLIAAGADVNARSHYGANSLWFAAYKGQTAVARILIRHKVDVNVRDTVWGETPMSMAVDNGNADLVALLLQAGAQGTDAALLAAVVGGRSQVARAILDNGKVNPETLSASFLILPTDAAEIRKALERKGGKPPVRGPDADALAPFEGKYESLNGGRLTLRAVSGSLICKDGSATYVLKWLASDDFGAVGHDDVRVHFERAQGRIARVSTRRGGNEAVFDRAPETPAAAAKPFATPEEDRPIPVTQARNWPSFRGPSASGVADGQHPPVRWDAESGLNILWKTAIPGLSHSSPIVWGDRIFLTSAVSAEAKPEFRPGLYGAGTPAKDATRHEWRVYCMDRGTGKILWHQTAHEGLPKTKRHIKSSQANPTPATDGRHVVAFFGSEGLYCYDMNGTLRWSQDVGIVDVGAFNEPELQWGSASSPVIYRDRVIVQCDRQKDSFIAAFDLVDGKLAWRTARDELPSWGTPTVVETGGGADELVTNGTKFVRAYDPLTGRELWRLGHNSEITVPTPVAGHGLVFVTSGYPPIRPIYAVRPGTRGDITLAANTTSSASVAWSKTRGGPYMPTPIVYGDYFYTCANNGTVTCYEARTGRQAYQTRLGSTDGYSASPVAADGRLYFTSEGGDVRVVKAGPTYQLLAINRMGDACMATPAISAGMIFIRSQHALYGVAHTQISARPAANTAPVAK
jgi:outer membrane protein assembly factor BamB